MIAKALSSLSEHIQIDMDNIFNRKINIIVVQTYSNTHGQHF